MGMSTTSVELSRQLYGLHDFMHQAFVASPVLGRPEAAQAGKLWLIMAGAAANIERCQPIVDVLGRGHTVVGSEPWQANLVKIGMNFTLASMLETLGEAFALIRKFGVDPSRFLDVMKNLYQSPVYANYGAIIAGRQFDPSGFRMKLGLKDVKLALSAAEAENVAMPLASLLRDHFIEGLARGYADRDWSAIAQVLEEHAGLKPVTATKPAGESGNSE
jgi:3-hydroxyisobutyrate dehydrogenase-like beta-hydroxyacid dehydrogenase